MRWIDGPILALAAWAAGSDAQSSRRPVPLPDPDPVVDSATDTRSSDERKQEVAYAATARHVPGLAAGMAQACRVQPWQFALHAEPNNAVKLDVSPTMTIPQRDCLKSVVYASRFHFNRR